MQDGVHVCGRIAALSGIICLAWYAVALMTTDWSFTDNYGNLGGVQVGYMEFGLSEFCFKTDVNTFLDSEHLICFSYDEKILLTDSTGVVVSDKTGYELFDGLEARRVVVFFGVAVSIAACFLGAVFSEKPVFNAVCLSISAIAGCVANSAWLNFQEELSSDSDMMVGTAGGLMIGAWMLSAVGAGMACWDRRLTADENRTNVFNDGISVFGRVASAGTIFTWLLFGLAVNSPQWSKTSDLGTAGGLCSRVVASNECGDASFGLWSYQIQAKTSIVSNGTEFVDVILFYDEAVNTGGVTADGNTRFDSYGVEIKRQVASGCVLIGILVSILADLFNEKLMFSATMMGLATIAGMIAMSSWVNFQEELSKDTASKVEFSDGGWLEVFAWLTAGFSTIAFCCNGRRLRAETGSSNVDASQA